MTTTSPVKNHGVKRKVNDKKVTYQLVLIRHGESEWNVKNIFTGWHDVPLSIKGEEEAHEAAQILKKNGFTFDLAFTSILKRAIKTLYIIMEEMDLLYIPVIKTWCLNERHYGLLQGLDKKKTVEKHGEKQVMIWRRSYDIPPPPLDKTSKYYPGNDIKYKNIPEKFLPLTESLKSTGERVLPFWEKKIKPEIKAGKKIIIAAHGNSIRSLVKYLDNILDDVITNINIPTGVPLVYDLDENFHPIRHKNSFLPLQGYYLGDQDIIKEKIEGVANQTKKK